MRTEFARAVQTPGLVAKKIGDPTKALAGAAKTITAEFEFLTSRMPPWSH